MIESELVMWRNFDKETSAKLGLDCFSKMYYIKYEYKTIRGNLNNYYTISMPPFDVLSFAMDKHLNDIPIIFKNKKSAEFFNKKHFAQIFGDSKVVKINTLNKKYNQGVILKPIYDTMIGKYLNKFRHEFIIDIDGEVFKCIEHVEPIDESYCSILNEHTHRVLSFSEVFEDTFDDICSPLVFENHAEANKFLSCINKVLKGYYDKSLLTAIDNHLAPTVTEIKSITVDKNNVTKL